MSNVDIAAEQGLSVNTIKAQLRSAYRKLGISGRSQLAELFNLGAN